MSNTQREYRRLTEDEENALSRLYPAVKQELRERPGVYMFQDGQNIVIELEEDISIPQQTFIRIVAEYKRLKTAQHSGGPRPRRSNSQSSPLSSQNDATRETGKE
ncbi:hypothetical protein CPAR01_12052 [Colletotrichum paranaense]|uniref:Uncharacterized protein n=2 Tax=Colletotrichum acutatum species complex TaxID=2707335 RepID=A0AAI9V5R5_9PEZI|nr:uncharacterized protein CPAR01_12052 [Colletotrichum paranaense]KAK1469850.1 hypothetical protein CMEL01_01617 [Colletotrichum melonis]KAK1529740.1 hypothetical protein CPAR01_12052 [Colletotrichum paranaense]